MKRALLILVWLLGLNLVARAQSAGQETQFAIDQAAGLVEKVDAFLSETNELYDIATVAHEQQLKSVENFMDLVDMRWQKFYDEHSEPLGSNEELMQMVVTYQQTNALVRDAIERRREQLKAQQEFKQAVKELKRNVPLYEKMNRKAQELALLPQLQAQLEELKTKEGLEMQKLTECYNTALAAVQNDNTLKPRWEEAEKHFILIKGLSQQIQQAQFTPLMQRAKDYLMSFAAASIILMFITFIISRIAAIKKAKTAARQIKEQMEKNDMSIPTI